MNNATNAPEGMLGVLGGMGPAATQLFYQWLIEHTPADTDQEHIPALVLSDTHMPDRTAAILSGNTEPVYRRLLADCKLLIGAGCTAIAIPCNTSHYFADQLQAEISVPILHMPRLAAAALQRRHVKKAAILATDGTVQTGVYARELDAVGIEPYAPDAAVQKQVMHLIYDVVKSGDMGSKKDFAPIDRAIRAAGCDAAVLGCTELSVYRECHGLPDDYYVDAMEELVRECVRRYKDGDALL